MFKRNLFYNGLLSISQFIFPLITFPYSSRILGPNGIGSINFIDSFTQYFIIFAALGIPLYGVREISKYSDDKLLRDKTFNEIFVIHICSSIAFSIIYLIAALLIPNLRVHLELVGIGIAMIFFGVLSAEWVFQGMEQFRYITSRTLIVRIISVIMLFAFLRTNSRPVVYYGILASGVIINGFINIIYLRKFVKFDFHNLHVKQHIKPLLIILGSSLAVSIYLLMDNVILGFLQSETAVGIYSTALRIVRLPLAIIGAVNAVIIPKISQAYHKRNFDELGEFANKSFSILCIFIFPVVTGIYVSSAFLVHLFAGNKFEGSVAALKILAPLVLINGLGNLVCIQLLAPMGKERYLLKAYLISMVFSLMINILLIKYYSFIGASYGLIITEIFATALCYYFLTKLIKLTFNLEVFFKCLVGSLFFFPIAYIIRLLISGNIVREVVIIITCMLVYALYVLFFIKLSYIQRYKALFLKMPALLKSKRNIQSYHIK